MESSFGIDTPDSYQPTRLTEPVRIRDTQDFLSKRDSYSPIQQTLVQREAALLGTDPVNNPDKFVESHNQLIQNLENDLNENFPELKDEVINEVAAYLAKDNKVSKDHIVQILRDRLAATTHIKIFDDFA